MNPLPRHYMPASIRAEQRADYDWDEWNANAYFRYTTAARFERLNRLTNKASLGLTIATLEWVVASLSSLTDVSIECRFLTAAWAGAVHHRYLNYTEFDPDEWSSPERGPLYLSLLILNDAVHELRSDPRIATRACWAYNLATHVLPEQEAFLAWWEACVQGLEQSHLEAEELAGAPRPDIFDDFPLQGLPLPPPVFDPINPTEVLPVAQIPARWDDFLRRLDPGTNEFLAAPKDLEDVDFLPGPPYRFEAR
ncbi:hypothetical protein [Roseateles chitosanitabidus]|uniref:hypothetical protein n=2 Tax=Roseateles chitosanitabidus TaxID=65048 RepID=UPI00082A6CF7|nr:hypothetical protein [Roseateles chitosanitabidus]